MNEFWKSAALVLIAVILGITIGKTEKDISVLLSMAVCSIVAIASFNYLAPVVDFLLELNAASAQQSDVLSILLKAVGIAMVSELTGLICSDAGNASLGKSFQMLGSAVILYMSLPLFRSLLTMIREILGEL